MSVDDAADAITRAFEVTSLSETLVADGYGIVVRVHRGSLELSDGIGATRRTRRIARYQASAGQVRRIIVLGDGMITTEAAAWCTALGIGLVIASPAGEMHTANAPALFDHAGLRRAQALALYTPLGIGIICQLLDRRLTDQARIARQHLDRPDVSDAIEQIRTTLSESRSAEDAMVREMKAADAYWTAWGSSVQLHFSPADRARVPEHWTGFTSRSSPLNHASVNRHAATPLNALLNYGYRLAEIEATLACLSLGLDPALGLLHANGNNRPAFALDLMETSRGLVEATVLQLARQRRFRKIEFSEQRDGEIRLVAPLTHEFVDALMPEFRRTLAAEAEAVASALTDLSAARITVPTHLTGSRRRPPANPDTTTARTSAVRASTGKLWSCPDCGRPVHDRQRVRCQECIETDPQQSPELRGKRGAAIRARKQAQAAWEAGGGAGTHDPATWTRIQPQLAPIPLAAIMKATGLSKGFSSRVRAGLSTPHPSHWMALAELASAHDDRA